MVGKNFHLLGNNLQCRLSATCRENVKRINSKIFKLLGSKNNFL